MLKYLHLLIVLASFLNHAAFASEQHQTWDGFEGNLKSFGLFNLNVWCPPSRVLNQFQFIRENRNGIPTGMFRYEYQCANGLSAPELNKRNTDWNDAGNGDTRYLDRHNVECEPNQALTDFRLIKEETTGRIGFEYGCANVHLDNVVQYETEFNDDGRGESIYLERHNVSCPSETVLNAFRLVRNEAQDNYKYVFKCGRIAAERHLKMPITNDKDCSRLLKVIQEDECFKNNGWFCDARFMRQFSYLFEPSLGDPGLKLPNLDGRPIFIPSPTERAHRRDRALTTCKFELEGNLFSAADYTESVLKIKGLAEVLKRETRFAQERLAK